MENLEHIGKDIDQSWLQWGHALGAWKTPTAQRVEQFWIRLQWGHALGAWKTRTGRNQQPRSVVLQWGHALGAWKTGRLNISNWQPSQASMGPCFRGMENVLAYRWLMA